ncbi:MAG: hypothetical protein GPJ54_04770 [Candidatus Heimdallarchaeota archaeon]|nr:hypothetical protein [Candidatus Heimdallarchaeota archaeon]
MLKIIAFFSPIALDSLKDEVNRYITNDLWQIIEQDSFDKDFSQNDFLLYLIGTGGTENLVRDFVSKHNPPSPIILLSYDLNNSLPAAMEIRTYLSSCGYEVNVIHASYKELPKKIGYIEHLLNVKEKMNETTLGLIGEPSDWLIASDIDREKVQGFWGIDIKDIPITESATELDGNINQSFFENATKSYVTELEVKKASSVAAKLKTIVNHHDLQALSIKCFDLLSLTDNITACCGLSYLNDIGITAGCEGDLPATVTMAFLKHLTGKAPFMSNVIHVDEDSNHVIIAHCTVATSIVEEYDLISHFETNKSVGIRGRFKTGIPVTICKLFGPSLTDYWVSTGTILRNIENDSACRTQLEIKLDKPVEYFLKDSLANHHIMTIGDYEKEIMMFFELFAN